MADSIEPAVERRASASGDEADESRLAQFGYQQELKRDWSLTHNFGISFSIISVITGITTLFGYGLNTGGPAVISVSWIIVSVFTMLVAIAMAEIVSAIPTSGGPYFWAGMLAPPRWSPFAAWLTGWFNLLGQASISFGLANLIATAAIVQNPDYVPTPAKTIGIYAAVLISHGVVNTFGVKILRYLNNTSIFLHSVGVTVLCIAILAKAPKHQPASFVFQKFYDGTGVDGADGWSIRASPAYLALCGSLLTQYTLTGFDASAHLSEETKKASWSAPIGVISSVGFSSLFGFFVIMTYLFSIQDFDRTLNSQYDQPVLQIFVDIAGERGALAMFSVIMVCVWHCGLFSMTSNSRMISKPHFFSKADARFRSPIRAVWLAATLSFILALPSLGSSHEGPFNLKGLSRPIAMAACAWIGTITVVFCLPTANPVTSQTLNYTVVAVGIIGIGAILSWVVWAHRWFTGPAEEVTKAMRLGVDLTEPGAFEEKAGEEKIGEKGVKVSDGSGS
ncbi:amino acid permease-domain-containing protein [Coniochaeta sp. 2T2.1]|nr:amino acid permease-domain-containing protein [Coniochaeta sp. 2T2.1]